MCVFQCDSGGFKPHPRAAARPVSSLAPNHRPALWHDGSTGPSGHRLSGPDGQGKVSRQRQQLSQDCPHVFIQVLWWSGTADCGSDSAFLFFSDEASLFLERSSILSSFLIFCLKSFLILGVPASSKCVFSVSRCGSCPLASCSCLFCLM